MDDTTTLTVRLSLELKECLGELAHSTKRTKSFLAGEAIAAYVKQEMDIIGGIHKGIDDVRAGRVVSHDEAMKRIRKTIGDATKPTKPEPR